MTHAIINNTRLRKRRVSDTPYPSSVSGCLKVTKTKYNKGDRKLSY